MVNKVILIGNLGKDPETKETGSGAKVAKLNLATNESYKDNAGEWQTKTEWHSVIMWQQQAERAAQLKKGDTVYIEGKLSTRKWEDNNQITRYTTEVITSYFRVINKRQAADDGPDWLK
jgi:single-strand DNA-binding protein